MIQDIRATVVTNTLFLEKYCRLRVEAREISEAISPGQFVNVLLSDEGAGRGSFEDLEEWRREVEPGSLGRRAVLRRPFSLHRLYWDKDGNRDGTLSILFEILGVGTEALSKVRPGDRVKLLGPLGKPLDLARHPDLPAGLVAGGMGLAPMLAAAQELAKRKRRVALIVGARNRFDMPAHYFATDEDESPSLAEFRELGADVRVVTEVDDELRTGMATDLLHEFLGGCAGECEVIACGPRAMLREAASMCAAYQTPCQVLLEEMMGCGFGVCMSCSVVTKNGLARVCQEGPAFDAEEICWEARWPTLK